MNRSIQSRLALSLTATSIALSAATGFLLYHFIGAEMIHNFDRGLQSNGRAVVSLVSLEAGGKLDFEFNEAVMPQYRPGKMAEYFQFRFADGRAYARSKSLGDGDLSFGKADSPPIESFYDLELPNRRMGRAIRIAFVPQSDLPQPTQAEPMVAVIARDRVELDENLQHLLQSLAGVTLLLGVATALTSLWIVRRSLNPLRQFAEQASAIDATKLDTRLSQHGLPAELAPICERLNDLLSRLGAAFSRERRFTSDVAHELRTPIAELRSIAEVAMKWPDDAEATHEALSESLAIAVQMQTLVNTLLSLVRTNENRDGIALSRLDLALFVEKTVAKLRTASAIHEIELSIPPTIGIHAEPALFGSVLTNLLLNSVEYSTGQHGVQCRASVHADHVHLTIENQADNLTAEDLLHIFEPFWRKDGSRTDHAHSGLGLALVRAYCGLMGIEVTATLDRGNLQICLVCALDRSEIGQEIESQAISAVR